MTDLVGHTLGKYHLVALLGQGRMDDERAQYGITDDEPTCPKP